MKKISILFIFVLLGSLYFFFSCAKDTELERFGFKGKVKSCTELHYTVIGEGENWEKGDLQVYGNSRVTFDEEGKYQKMEYLDRDLNVSGKLVPAFENGKLTEEKYFGGDGEYRSISKYKYISDNQINFESFDTSGELLATGTSFIENLRVVKQEYKRVGEPVTGFITQFEYNEKGFLLSQKQVDLENNLNSHRIFKYLKVDEQGNWTKRLDYAADYKEEPDHIQIREIEYY